MKGIILAGGSGTRLYPLTIACTKQLLPVYDKPLIYYPLSVLMLAGIREILIISTPEDINRFKDIFSDGSHIGLNISYAVQPRPEGIAQAFIIGEEFIGSEDVCLVLGDNLIYGEGLISLLKKSRQIVEQNRHGVVFAYSVGDPQSYGVVEFNSDNIAISLEEKPANPKSNFAVIGLYLYPNDVIQFARNLKPSKRNELEITDLNKLFLAENRLFVEVLGRGYAWLDTGTHENLLEAGVFIEVIERRQGLKIACIEEIAFKMGYINPDQFTSLAHKLSKSRYGQYLLKILNNKK